MGEQKWNEVEIESGLAAVALCGGNTSQAEKVLASRNLPIPRTTLKDWIESVYPERYTQTLANLKDNIGEYVASEAMDIAAAQTIAEKQVIQKLQSQIVGEEMPVKDLANAAQKLAQAKETNARTSRLLREQSTNITEVRDPAEIIAELTHLGVLKKGA